MRFAIPVAMTIALALSPARAQSPSIEIEGAWARATIGQSKTSAAYMRITNRGNAPDRLIGAASAAADKAALHATTRDGDVLKMREVEPVEIKPGDSIVLEPGGLHLMLTGLHHPLKAGEHVTLTLRFEGAGAVETTAEIRAPGNHGAHGSHGHHGH
ncbi:MAG TPA: copper chaperone PCu(A)C [Alphaproteobacteria bacterium]